MYWKPWAANSLQMMNAKSGLMPVFLINWLNCSRMFQMILLCPQPFRFIPEFYSQHLCNETTIYDGIEELLEEADENGTALFIYTNKPQELAIEIAAQLFRPDMLHGFSVSVPERSNKPWPEGIKAVLDNIDFRPEEILFIGDTSLDVRTAANGGMDSVAVTWACFPESNYRKKNPCIWLIILLN